jgi:hypothetical protein
MDPLPLSLITSEHVLVAKLIATFVFLLCHTTPPPKKKKNKKKKLVDVCCRFALSVLKAKDDEFRQKTERLAAARTSLFFVLTASLTYVSKFSLPQILTRGIENR